jgi:hypothetical protein
MRWHRMTGQEIFLIDDVGHKSPSRRITENLRRSK